MQCFVEPEMKFCFGGHSNFVSFGQDLNTAACNRAGDCADSRALTATGYGSEQRAEHGAAADHFTSATIHANAIRIFGFQILCADAISPSIHTNRIQVEHQVTVA